MIAVVNSIAEKVAVMRDGAIIEKGDAQTVLASPRHDYTAALVGAATTFEDALAGRS